jgi:hypothetical protein
MKEPTPEGASVELIVTLNRLNDRLEAIQKAGTTQTVTLSSGSFGIWIAAFSAVVCFLMFCVTLVLFVNHDRKIDDLNSYLSAIYAQAPHLKPDGEYKDEASK